MQQIYCRNRWRLWQAITNTPKTTASLRRTTYAPNGTFWSILKPIVWAAPGLQRNAREDSRISLKESPSFCRICDANTTSRPTEATARKSPHRQSWSIGTRIATYRLRPPRQWVLMIGRSRQKITDWKSRCSSRTSTGWSSSSSNCARNEGTAPARWTTSGLKRLFSTTTSLLSKAKNRWFQNAPKMNHRRMPRDYRQTNNPKGLRLTRTLLMAMQTTLEVP